jgi:hypothetical protein
MNLSIGISLRKPAPPAPVPSLPPGVWAQARHDSERPEYFRKDLGYSVPRSIFDPRDKLTDSKGFPETVPLSPRNGVKLTRELQWFWFAQLILSLYGIKIRESREGDRIVTWEEDFARKLAPAQREKMLVAWAGLTKSFTAFTNGSGTDDPTRRDYVRKLRLGARELPILWELTCGGSLLRLHSAANSGAGYKVLALNPARYNEWKDYDFKRNPGFFTLATNSVAKNLQGDFSIVGPWRVTPFHYLDNKDVPIPIMSNLGFVYIRADRVRILKEGDRFPPRAYIP